MMIRVLIADDHPVVRDGIRNVLESQSDMEIVGEAINGDEALAQALALRPDVLVLDVQMPGLSAPQVVRRLRQHEDLPHVLVLTAYGNTEYVLGMMRAGAEGYLLKDEDPAVIADGVRAVARGQVWLSEVVGRTISQELERGIPGRWQTPSEVLTQRELEILGLLATGRGNDQIAEELKIAEGTVRNHVSSIYSKLAVGSRAEAVAWAWQHGVVVK